MSAAEVWFGGSGAMYIDRSALVVRRHEESYMGGEPGHWPWSTTSATSCGCLS